MKQWILGIMSLVVVVFSTAVQANANTIENVRVWPAPDNTRVVFDMASTPEFSYFTIYDNLPYRLVIDFENTGRQVDLTKVKVDSLLIQKLRTSTPKSKSSTRIVFE
ncbi:N-acetylmuramoyl-L-alanine amidase, partial [Pseudidiomarina aestuarii]